MQLIISPNAFLPFLLLLLLSSYRASVDNALVDYEKRTFEEEMKYIEKISECCYRIKKGFVPNMKVRSRGCSCFACSCLAC
jgi:hypothetical protein